VSALSKPESAHRIPAVDDQSLLTRLPALALVVVPFEMIAEYEKMTIEMVPHKRLVGSIPPLPDERHTPRQCRPNRQSASPHCPDVAARALQLQLAMPDARRRGT
jgi:hypothetical protein